MDLTSIVLAPVRLPGQFVRALEDLNAIAERARRDPDPVDQVRERLDLALAELGRVGDLARTLEATLTVAVQGIELLTRVGENLDVTGQQIIVGGRDLNLTGRTLDTQTRELIDGGAELTEVSRRLATDIATFKALLPQIVSMLDTVERLEGEVETVAETVEPLQGAAERVGRVTRRLSRSSS